jgi:hypothetical protein
MRVPKTPEERRFGFRRVTDSSETAGAARRSLSGRFLGFQTVAEEKIRNM